MSNDKKENKYLRLIILILLLLIFVISGVILIVKLVPPKNENKEKYQTSSTDVEENLPDNPIDFNKLKSDNPDVIGWLKVDGTPIDYPILMSGVDKEEDFYINHDLNCQKKTAGSIYVQRDNASDFTDFNTLIYGHNMMNGSMFGTLKKFRNANFFKENRNIYIYAPKHILHYEISSAFLYDDRHILSSYNFFEQEGRQQFIDVCKNPSTLVKNIIDNLSIADNDRLVTLSTCTSVNNERYLVVGRLIEVTKTK